MPGCPKTLLDLPQRKALSCTGPPRNSVTKSRDAGYAQPPLLVLVKTNVERREVIAERAEPTTPVSGQAHDVPFPFQRRAGRDLKWATVGADVIPIARGLSNSRERDVLTARVLQGVPP